MSTFKDFNLLPTLQATLNEKKFTKPTEIQSKAMPLLLKGTSVVGVAETGSGKTLAYALPILHQIKKLELDGDAVKTESKPRALVVVPTRELGEQVTKVFKPFTHETRLRVRAVLGGTTFEMARRSISGAFEVLVATPGRLVKLLEMELVDLSDVKILVFDEVDQMLDKGFLPDAHKIVAACPTEKQLALFSATVSPSVQTLMNEVFSEATVVKSEGSHKLVASLKTINKNIENGKRFPVLEELLSQPTQGGTIIFTNTREQCDKLATSIKTLGLSCVIYRGEMDKVVRRKNLQAFREGKIDLLISTDLASRGLDVEHVGRVINYHMPQQMENYIHRVGRTARAGRSGVVINFVTERDEAFVKQLSQVKAGGSGGSWGSGPEFKKPEKIKQKFQVVVKKRA